MKPVVVQLNALVLDFDGVVLESTEIKARAFTELFNDHPEHLERIARYHAEHLGMSRYKKFTWIYQELLKEPLSEEKLVELGDRYSELVFEKILRAPFVPGAHETLENARSLGLPTFLISGTPHDELLRILAGRGLERYFIEVWGSPQEKRAAIQEIRSKYRLDPAEMLMIGDGFFDYEAAAGEGLPFIARRSGADEVDWEALAVPSLPDLTRLARLKRDATVTIPSRDPRVPPMSLTVKGA